MTLPSTRSSLVFSNHMVLQYPRSTFKLLKNNSLAAEVPRFHRTAQAAVEGVTTVDTPKSVIPLRLAPAKSIPPHVQVPSVSLEAFGSFITIWEVVEPLPRKM